MAEGLAAAVFPMFPPFFAGGAFAVCEGLATAGLALAALFFPALLLADDLEDVAVTDFGASLVGFHAAAVAFRVAWNGETKIAHNINKK
jgi:hypothetical protein